MRICLIQLIEKSGLYIFDGTSDMKTTNDYKGYEPQLQRHRGQVGHCIIWQDIYINFQTTYEYHVIEYYNSLVTDKSLN